MLSPVYPRVLNSSQSPSRERYGAEPRAGAAPLVVSSPLAVCVLTFHLHHPPKKYTQPVVLVCAHHCRTRLYCVFLPDTPNGARGAKRKREETPAEKKDQPGKQKKTKTTRKGEPQSARRQSSVLSVAVRTDGIGGLVVLRVLLLVAVLVLSLCCCITTRFNPSHNQGCSRRGGRTRTPCP
jgi:hypothetical protein